MTQFYIYKITNLINGKVYIGKTSDIKKRWIQHLSDARHPDRCKPIHNAINKYGKDNFTIEIIDTHIDEHQISILEQHWIFNYKSNIIKYGDEFGYNLTDGGEGLTGNISGENNPKSKLTKEDVLNIRNSILPTKDLVEKFSVSRGTIQRIRSGKTWKESFEVKIFSVNEEMEKQNLLRLNKSGENGPNTKLNWDTVNQIRNDYQLGNTNISNLSRIYNVSWLTIKCIITNVTWKN